MTSWTRSLYPHVKSENCVDYDIAVPWRKGDPSEEEPYDLVISDYFLDTGLD
jgi:hypothetical protein